MREASRIVLDDFELGTDSVIASFPDRYMDERGKAMWEKVMALLDWAESGDVVNGTTARCQVSNTALSA